MENPASMNLYHNDHIEIKDEASVTIVVSRGARAVVGGAFGQGWLPPQHRVTPHSAALSSISGTQDEDVAITVWSFSSCKVKFICI